MRQLFAADNLETRTEVTKHFAKAKQNTKDWHAKIQRRRNLYNLDHYQGEEKPGEDRYNDPTYTNMVDMVIGILLANGLEWEARGWTPGSLEQKDSSHIEKLLAGLVYISSVREEVSVPYEVLLNFSRDGAGVLYSIWDNRLSKQHFETVVVPDKREENPHGTRSIGLYKEPPILTKVIDPLKIFPVPGGSDRWLQIMRVEKMSIYDMEMTYQVELDQHKHLNIRQKMNKSLELIDFWCYADEEVETDKMDELGNPVMKTQRVVKNAIIFGSYVVEPMRVMTGYDTIPYLIGFFKPVNPDDPKDWGHSIIDPLEPSVTMLERSTNRRSRQILLYSSMPLVVKSNRKIKLDQGIGNTLELQPQEDIGFPVWPGNPPDVKDHVDFLTARIQQSGFSDVMFGTQDVASGFALNQLGDQNRIRMQQPREHLQLFWSRWAAQVLKLISSMAKDSIVRVYGRLKGRDFMDQVFTEDLANYFVQCKVRPEFPNDKTRNHAMATQARGVLSESTLMEKYYEIEQPDDERERKLQEMAETHPLMVQHAMIKKLRSMAEEGDDDAAMVLQLMAKQGGPSGGPKPPGTSKPEQMVGMSSSTGQPTPQEMGGQPPGQSDQDKMTQQANAAVNMMGGIQ